MEIENCTNNPLPPNFDKCSNIIKYFRDNGLDCLSSLSEQFRFFIRYIYSENESLNMRFYNEKNNKTNLSYKKRFSWGEWDDKGHGRNSYNFYNLNTLEFRTQNLNKNNKATKEFLYDELSNVSDGKIKQYFIELYDYGKLIEQNNDVITITNKFNDSKIVINRFDFMKYCGYSNLLTDHNHINTFVIDIIFNDKIAKHISCLINNSPDISLYNYTLEELEQKFALIDFLQININYDAAK